jgi:hypothetical protein
MGMVVVEGGLVKLPPPARHQTVHTEGGHLMVVVEG